MGGTRCSGFAHKRYSGGNVGVGSVEIEEGRRGVNIQDRIAGGSGRNVCGDVPA